MGVHLPIWFILSTYSLGIIFLYLGFRIWSRKQVSLLGNIGELKIEKDLDTVYKLTSVYCFVLGAIFIFVPAVNLLFDLVAVTIIVAAAMIGSIIFWFTMQKLFFIHSV